MRRAAFTLIELLVVIAIIALLIGILLPALGAARNAGRVVQDLSQMRQLAVAQALYANDTDDTLIDATLPHGGGAPAEEVRSSWLFELEPYFETTAVYKSPLDRSTAWSEPDGGSSTNLSRGEAIALINDRDPANDPDGAVIARWTSYGLNDQTTTKFVERPGFQPVRRLSSAQFPTSLVHFAPMTVDGFGPNDLGSSNPLSSQYDTADHMHPFLWQPPAFGTATPDIRRAAEQMEPHLHGGEEDNPSSARAGYVFLDAHADSLSFEAVHPNYLESRFRPEPGTTP
ncbi:MAG: prepilin-type N-terminal cleavage/methylation domain-containing protein [Planctomycetota bacterium]